MNPDEMTAEQLRAMADAMEGAPKPEGDVRLIEVDGVPLSIDMRAVRDVRTLRLIGRIQKGGDDAAFDAIELFDRLLGDQVAEVESALSDADGFCDAERYSEFAAKVFAAVEAKN